MDCALFGDFVELAHVIFTRQLKHFTFTTCNVQPIVCAGMSVAIFFTKRAKVFFRRRDSVEYWSCEVSRRATLPGVHFFFCGPSASFAFRAALISAACRSFPSEAFIVAWSVCAITKQRRSEWTWKILDNGSAHSVYNAEGASTVQHFKRKITYFINYDQK